MCVHCDSNPSHHSVDYIDLQVDYWSSNAVSKKDAGKVYMCDHISCIESCLSRFAVRLL